MRFLPHLIAVIALTLAGLFLYKLGRSNATIVCEQAKTEDVATVSVEMVKAVKQRDTIDNEARKIPDTSLDAALDDGGWLRD